MARRLPAPQTRRDFRRPLRVAPAHAKAQDFDPSWREISLQRYGFNTIRTNQSRKRNLKVFLFLLCRSGPWAQSAGNQPLRGRSILPCGMLLQRNDRRLFRKGFEGDHAGIAALYDGTVSEINSARVRSCRCCALSLLDRCVDQNVLFGYPQDPER